MKGQILKTMTVDRWYGSLTIECTPEAMNVERVTEGVCGFTDEHYGPWAGTVVSVEFTDDERLLAEWETSDTPPGVKLQGEIDEGKIGVSPDIALIEYDIQDREDSWMVDVQATFSELLSLASVGRPAIPSSHSESSMSEHGWIESLGVNDTRPPKGFNDEIFERVSRRRAEFGLDTPDIDEELKGTGAQQLSEETALEDDHGDDEDEEDEAMGDEQDTTTLETTATPVEELAVHADTMVRLAGGEDTERGKAMRQAALDLALQGGEQSGAELIAAFGEKVKTIATTPLTDLARSQSSVPGRRFDIGALMAAFAMTDHGQANQLVAYEMERLGYDALARREITLPDEILVEASGMDPMLAAEYRGKILPSALMDGGRRVASLEVGTATVTAVTQTDIRRDLLVTQLLDPAAEAIVMLPQMMAGVNGPFNVPRETRQLAGGWKTEGNHAAETTTAYGDIQFRFKTVEVPVTLRYETRHTVPEAWIRANLVDQIRRARTTHIASAMVNDGVVIAGAPVSLYKTAGINDVDYGSALADFGRDDAIKTGNALSDKAISAMSRAWIMAGELLTHCETTLVDTGSGKYIAARPSYDMRMPYEQMMGIEPDVIDGQGHRAYRTSYFTTAKGRALYAEWNQVLWAIWGNGLTIVIDDVTSAGDIKTTILQPMDWHPLRTDAVAKVHFD